MTKFIYGTNQKFPKVNNADLMLHTLFADIFDIADKIAALMDVIDRQGLQEVYFLNPMIVQFLSDDEAKNNVFYYDRHGNLVALGENEFTSKKLTVMDAGEVLMDCDFIMDCYDKVVK